MRMLPGCTAKRFNETGIGELVRLDDGSSGIVGLLGQTGAERKKVVACLPSDADIDKAPWLAFPSAENTTVLSLGTDHLVWFDPLRATVSRVGLSRPNTPGVLIVGEGSLAIVVAHPKRVPGWDSYEVVIQEPSADQGNDGLIRFTILDWQIRPPVPCDGQPPLFSLKAG